MLGVQVTPERVGPYRLEGPLGAGGMAEVFRAVAPDGRRVALKRLRADADVELALRFAREGRLQRELGAVEGLVPLLDALEEGGERWLVLPLYEGGSLAELLRRRGRLPAPEVIALGRRLARALGHAHAHGVVHRDVKPDNVLLDGAGQAHLADLGVARRTAPAPGAAASAALTGSGAVVGTPAYAAPEQLGVGATAAGRGHAGVGPQADVFALGVVLFECLAGARPFAGATLLDLAEALERGERPALLDLAPETPPALARVVEACLAVDPTRRPADGAALARALDDVAGALGLSGERPPTSSATPARRPGRRRLAGALALAVAAVGAAAAVVTRSHLAGVADHARPGGRPGPDLPGGPGAQGWSLARDGGFTVDDPALWADAEAREAWPLRGLEEPAAAALAGAFDGEVTRLDGGRLRVRYDLGAGARRRPEVSDPLVLALGGRGDPLLAAGVLAAPGAAVAVLPAGSAVWRDARVALELAPEAGAGGGPGGLPREVGLDAGGHLLRVDLLAGAIRLDERAAPAPRPGTPVAHLEVDPTAARVEQRVRVDGHALGALGEGLGGAARRAGRVAVWVHDGRVALARATVEGRPLRVDRPARAAAPLPSASNGLAPGEARVEADVERSGSGLEDGLVGRSVGGGGGHDVDPHGAPGGPFVGLGGPAGPDDALELQGDLLVLRRGERVLATARAPGLPRRIRLVLVRRDGVLAGRVEPADGEASPSQGPGPPRPAPAAARVASSDPLPLGAAAACAAWGSTGPRARFLRVVAVAGPRAPAREAYDAAGAAGPAAAAEALEAAGAAGPAAGAQAAGWAGAAWLDHALTAPGLRGPAPGAARARREALARARLALDRAADAPGPALPGDGARPGDPGSPVASRRDARARAALCAALLGDAADAAARGAALAGEPGGVAAADAVLLDARGRPALLARLSAGHPLVDAPFDPGDALRGLGLDLVEGPPLRVAGVEPGSAAARAGLRPGDRIDAVGPVVAGAQRLHGVAADGAPGAWDVPPQHPAWATLALAGALEPARAGALEQWRARLAAAAIEPLARRLLAAPDPARDPADVRLALAALEDVAGRAVRARAAAAASSAASPQEGGLAARAGIAAAKQLGDALERLAGLDPARRAPLLALALAAWRDARRAEPEAWWSCAQVARLEAAAGAPEAAIEAAIATVARRPGARDLLRTPELAAALAAAPPALRAVGHLVAGAPALAARAAREALEGAGGDREAADLAAYALLRAEGAAPRAPPGPGPRGTLLRAALDEADAAALARAARADPLVHDLARLDPALAPLLRGP